MADTCRGNFPEKYCADCGKKGCYFKHWGPLCPGGAVGYFDECFSIRSEQIRLEPKPFEFDSNTGKQLYPKGLSESEPAPVANENPAVWDLVIKDMQERDTVGFERYGVRLQANNGRDALVDAYQEALDLVVYIRQTLEEHITKDTPIPMVLHCPNCYTLHIDLPDEQCDFTSHDFGVLPSTARCVKKKGHGKEEHPLVIHSAEDRFMRWTNPPHKTHQCSNCETRWRPANVFTVGVTGEEIIPGKSDTWKWETN